MNHKAIANGLAKKLLSTYLIFMAFRYLGFFELGSICPSIVCDLSFLWTLIYIRIYSED
ncbi:hypothetical protein GGQ74_001185 [Desulfobaculum xiamenense]|uniref:Uncharacterized protein n=1 Tax=Desulfobaculum xiamenense TaxID=995050 RepID=A0A846QQ69_9BACT|nr:hypothetical protein [Desulfobaculum xiamenense]